MSVDKARQAAAEASLASPTDSESCVAPEVREIERMQHAGFGLRLTQACLG